MSSIYAYSCRCQHDEKSGVNEFTGIIDRACVPFIKGLHELDESYAWAGITLDGYPALETRLFLREGWKEIDKRMKTGDAVLLYGIERVFLDMEDMFKATDALTTQGIRVVLVDLGLSIGSAATDKMFAIVRRCLEHGALRKELLRKPKIV